MRSGLREVLCSYLRRWEGGQMNSRLISLDALVAAPFASTDSLRITTDTDVNRRGGDAEGDEALTLHGMLLGRTVGDGFSGWSV